jgi:hypothetical protein
MLRIFLFVGVFGLAAIGTAFAQNCSCAGGTRQNQTQIVTALAGKTVCAVLGAESWKEFHSGTTAAGGPLIETGPVTAETVGSWQVLGTGANATVSYNYGTGGTYGYEVCLDGANVNFCGAKNITNATIKTGQGGC